MNSPREMRPNEKAAELAWLWLGAEKPVSPTLAMLRERAVRLAHGDRDLYTLLKSAERVAPVLAAMPERWRQADFDADKEV